MREKLLHYIRERQLLRAGERVAVAVSGGADSVALLRVLLELRAELGIALAVAHFNHQLRGEESDADERFVAELAAKCELPFFAGRANVREHAETNKLSLEHAARELRYQWLLELRRDQRFDAIATAHSADDQAETVLMKFLRGAGTRGLAGIHPVLMRGGVRIVRPLLATTRTEVEAYLAACSQEWREDHSNHDTQFTRNRIRHELLPLLERDYNRNLRRLLSDTAVFALAEEDYWHGEASPDFATRHLEAGRFLLPGFNQVHVALQRRLLKGFLESESVAADFHHVESLRRCALGESARVSLPDGWLAIKEGECLRLRQPEAAEPETPGYQYLLAIPGAVRIVEIAATISATLVDRESADQSEPGTLLCADSLGPKLLIRNWQPGDRFRPAHTGSEEKLKRLFSEKHIPADQRPMWPVALSGSQIVWVRGFRPAHDFTWIPGSGEAVRIDALDDK